MDRFVGEASRGPAKQEERITNGLSLVRREAASQNRIGLATNLRVDLRPIITTLRRGAAEVAEDIQTSAKERVLNKILAKTATVFACFVSAAVLGEHSIIEIIKEVAGQPTNQASIMLQQLIPNLIVLTLPLAGSMLLANTVHEIRKARRAIRKQRAKNQHTQTEKTSSEEARTDPKVVLGTAA